MFSLFSLSSSPSTVPPLLSLSRISLTHHGLLLTRAILPPLSLRRAPRALEHGRSHNRHEHPRLPPGHDLRSLSRPPRPPRARWRRHVHRLHQHHRLLCPLRPRLRPRAYLLPSLRLPKPPSRFSFLPAHHPPPSRLLPPHFSPLAEHHPHPLHPPKARPRDNGHSRHLLFLLSSRLGHELFFAASESLPALSGDHKTLDVVLRSGCSPPHTSELAVRVRL